MKNLPPAGRLTRRGFLAAAAAVTVTACSKSNEASPSASDGTSADNSSNASAGPSGSGSASAGAGVFPVTIKHALGTTQIPSEPRRIVTLGQGAAEAAIALGTVPVGTETYPWGADKQGHLPWVREAIEKQGKPLPTPLPTGDAPAIEKIAALNPDLILAPWSGITKDQYQQLTQIAPTLAYEKAAWSTTWDGEIRQVAKALGKPQQGEQIIATINKQLADAAAAHPQYKGKKFSYIYTTGPGTLGVYMPTEQRVAMIAKLGLTPDPAVLAFKPKSGLDYALIGLENGDKLKNSDLIFTWYLDAASKKQVMAQPLYAAIPAIKRGAVVTSSDPQLVTGMSMINPLTVPWSLPRLTALIDAQINKH